VARGTMSADTKCGHQIQTLLTDGRHRMHVGRRAHRDLAAVADASVFAYRMDVEKGDVRDRAPVPDPILGGMQQESFLSAGSVTVTAC